MVCQCIYYIKMNSVFGRLEVVACLVVEEDKALHIWAVVMVVAFAFSRLVLCNLRSP